MIKRISHVGIAVKDLDEAIKTYETDDISGETHRMRGEGVNLIHERPFVGAHGVPIAFISPKSVHGVTVESMECWME